MDSNTPVEESPAPPADVTANIVDAGNATLDDSAAPQAPHSRRRFLTTAALSSAALAAAACYPTDAVTTVATPSPTTTSFPPPPPAPPAAPHPADVYTPSTMAPPPPSTILPAPTTTTSPPTSEPEISSPTATSTADSTSAPIIPDAGSTTTSGDLYAAIPAGYPHPDALPPIVALDTSAAPATLSPQDIAHVLRRTGFGPNAESRLALTTMGFPAYLEAQLNPGSLVDTQMDPIMALFPELHMEPLEIDDVGTPWMVPPQLAAAAVLRGTYSKRQLQEAMVMFWADHFSVDSDNNDVMYHLPWHDEHVTRALCLSSFKEILMATAKSPAMIHFLNQFDSRADKTNTPNQNYARELMELHTVGVNGGYNETDVAEVSYLFSGWSLTDRLGTFYFKKWWHAPGPLATSGDVLGWTPNGLDGQPACESFLNYLATLPQTATRLCYKLAVRFIGETVTPTSPVVVSMAQAYLANDTQIKPVLRVLFNSAEFWSSHGARFKRPVDYTASLLRATESTFNPTDANAPDVVWFAWSWMQAMGQLPYGWPAPNGFPDADGYWMSVGPMIRRWNYATLVAVSAINGLSCQPANFFGPGLPATVGDAFSRACQAVYGYPPSASTLNALVASTGRAATSVFRSNETWRLPGWLAFVLQAPELQER